MKKNYFLVLLVCFATFCNADSYRAFCTAPVADIVSAPFTKETSTYEEVKKEYENIPTSWGPTRADLLACPRIHQLLLHEIVVVLEENKYEAFIEILPLIAVNEKGMNPVRGWMFKDHLRQIKQDSQWLLPAPIEWKSGVICDNEQCIALISPFVDQDKKLYSAGTRFLLYNTINENFHVYAFDDELGRFKTISIPEQLCAYQPTMAEYDKRILFCTLIELWSQIPESSIPLVWGGASIARTYADEDFYSVKRLINGQSLQAWDRPLYGFTIHMGTDASNLVSRAAQLVGIPYFWKNSTTAAFMLNELNAHEYPQLGDLIWIPGSLLIISDIEHNSIVAAMSYSAGYGTIVKLPLHQLFKDINTFDDLLNAKKIDKPLSILNRDGSIAREIQEFKILKLM